MNDNEIQAHIDALSVKIKNDQKQVIDIYNQYRIREGRPEKSGLLSLHGTIGGKNNIFTDSIRTQFLNPEDYIAQWINGLCKKYGSKHEYLAPKYRHIIIEMLREPICKEYIYNFLERNFYRNMIERIRTKPDESLWEIWFGDQRLFWGLFITPVNRRGKWVNDVSEIRRARFNYWTIGHVLQTGLVDLENDELITFSSLEDFYGFYKGILKRLSTSEYEKTLMTYYIEYVIHTDVPLDQPLLIPEIRYAGKEKYHQYRLDFTILNIYTQQYIGFEISPQSTHMSVTKVKDKSQGQLNAELAEKWEKETQKETRISKHSTLTQ